MIKNDMGSSGHQNDTKFLSLGESSVKIEENLKVF